MNEQRYKVLLYLLRGAVTETVSTFTLKTQVVLDRLSGARSPLYCQIYVYIAALEPTLLFNRVQIKPQKRVLSHATSSLRNRRHTIIYSTKIRNIEEEDILYDWH